jgi:oligosaccharide repeat unit polymerase
MAILFSKRGIWFPPSFYGAAGFGVAYSLYLMPILRYDQGSALLHFLCLLVIASYLSSSVIFSSLYARSLTDKSRQGEIEQIDKAVPYVLHLVGFLGLALYIRDLLHELGSFSALVLVLLNSPHEIRQARVESIGTQLSYFGWLGIFITPFVKSRSKGLKTVAVVQVLLNLLYIDRTRPMWILFILGLVIFLESGDGRTWKSRAVLIKGILGISVFISLFFLIGSFVGKVGSGLADDREGGFTGLAYSLYFYITSSFGYFDQVLAQNPDPIGVAGRLLYPLYRVLESLSIAHGPPSQILEFKSAPYLTNVGTFLEPFYMEGGLLGVVLGIILYSFVFDIIGLVLLNSRRAFGIVAWANLCFCTGISFFVPKSVTTAFWLIFLFGAVSALLPQKRVEGRHVTSVL